MFYLAILSQNIYGQCDTPLNLTVSYNNITNESTFSWDPVGTATEYRFQLKFQWDTWTTTSAPLQEIGTETSYSFTGLATSFPFEWRVSAICNTLESSLSPTQNYTVPCPLPNGLSSTNITSTSALLHWNSFPGYSPNTAAFVIAYRILNSGAAWTPIGNSTTFSISVAGLQANTTYEWCVNTTCSFFNSAPVISQFTTAPPPCNLLAGNLRSQATTHNYNKLVWDAVSGATNYTVQYKRNSDVNWITSNTNINFLELSGLNQETLYDFRVRVNCTSGNGNYSTIAQFHTYSAFCRSYGVNTWEWIDLFSLGTINRVSGKDVQGYFNSSQSTDLVIGSTGNVGQLSAGFNPGESYTDRFVIYIDFNRNGDFNDPGERVLAPLTTNNGNNYNFSISIPNNVTPGPTKLKVVMRRGGATNTPCAQGTRGEVEDYVVNLVGSSNRNIDNYIHQDELNPLTQSRSVSDDDIKITPNPSDGIFTLNVYENFQPSSYKIFNSIHSLVQQKSLSNDSSQQIDLSESRPGLYFMILTNQIGESRLVRLIKM
ncbi:MAG: fibronectin type III domain-containing protein [Saprospiraceae bacterium]|nr:fibronectin type III domain-containing protein [Saprospiraceae bacterium]